MKNNELSLPYVQMTDSQFALYLAIRTSDCNIVKDQLERAENYYKFLKSKK